MGRKEWPSELIKTLIGMYKERPSLWKLNLPDYQNKRVRSRAYQQIVDEVRKTIPDANLDLVRAKIQNMRTCFRKEQKKVEASKRSGGAEEIYEPSLWYFEQLSFIVDEQEAPSANYKHENEEGSPQDPDGFPDGSQSQISYVDDNEDSEVEDTNEEPWSEVQPHVEIHPYFRGPQPPAPKRSKVARTVQPATSDLLKTLTSALTADTENDEFTTAGRYIAQKLKRMSQPQQILAESIIQEVMSKGLRNKLSDTTALVD